MFNRKLVIGTIGAILGGLMVLLMYLILFPSSLGRYTAPMAIADVKGAKDPHTELLARVEEIEHRMIVLHPGILTTPPDVAADLCEAVRAIGQANAADPRLTHAGKPRTAVLAQAIGRPVTATERDKALVLCPAGQAHPHPPTEPPHE